MEEEYVKITLDRYDKLKTCEDAFNKGACIVTTGWENGFRWNSIWIADNDEVLQHLKEKVERLESELDSVESKLAKRETRKGFFR